MDSVKRVKVKPAEGRRVLHPRSFQPIPDNGKLVKENDPYWRRRILAGDVVKIGESVVTPLPTEEEGDEE